MSTNAQTKTRRQPSASRARTRSSGRKNDRGASVTSERIAADLAAFRKSGGKIEVLGNTKVFKNVGPMTSSSKTAKAKKAAATAAAKKRA